MERKGELYCGIGDGMTDLIRDTFWFEQRFGWSKSVLDCFMGITEEQKYKILIGDAFIKPIEENRRVEVVFEKDVDFKNQLKKHINSVKQRAEWMDKEIYDLKLAVDKEEFGFFSTNDEGRVYQLKKSIKKLERKRKGCEELLVHYNHLFFEKVKVDTTVNLGGFEVPKFMLEDYVEGVVKRLRTVMKCPEYARMQDPLAIIDLERRREKLHKKILEAIGIKERKGNEYMRFSEALEKYLEEMGAGLYS